MDIDRNRVLCVPAYNLDVDPTWLELYRVDGILSLQNVPGRLQGHPGYDMDEHLEPHPDGAAWCQGIHRPKSEVKRVDKWTQQGYLVTVTQAHPGKRKRNRPQLLLSWAKKDDWLTPDQQAWLLAYSDSSFIWSDEKAAREAWGRIWAAIAEVGQARKAAQKPEPKKAKGKKKGKGAKPPASKPKVKRKERRSREQDHYYQGANHE